MTYKIALNFEDGVTRIIECDASERVTDAAFRQRINIPMDCRDGVCGTCKCRCEEGDYDLDFYLDDAMTQEEASARYVLTCQMTPNSDCVLSVPASAAACKTGAQSVGGTVTAIEALSDTAFRLEIELAHPLPFLPGQYANVSIPGTKETRSYSFSSPAGTTCTFLIRNLPDGMMSTYLAQRARPGDAVELTGPMGVFYLRPVNRAQLWLAGGTGLAPFLSMLEHLAATGCDHPVTLYYAVTRAADLVELARLEDLAARVGNVTLVTIVAAAEDGHERTGFVTDHLAAADLRNGEVDVYLCGPPPMVEAVRQHFAALGVNPAAFYFEKFNPADEAIEAA